MPFGPCFLNNNYCLITFTIIHNNIILERKNCFENNLTFKASYPKEHGRTAKVHF